MAIQLNFVSSMLILVLLSISSVEGQGGGGATLDGPCKAPIELQVEGTVKDPADLLLPISLNGLPSIELKISNCLVEDFSTAREPLLIKRKVAKVMIIVVHFLFKNCTMTNTSNGARIKSWAGAEPGTCSNIHFEDITMTNVSSTIIIDQKYCLWKKCKINEESIVKLSNISFKNIQGTSARPKAVKIICSATLPCENVEFVDIEIMHCGPTGPAVSQCLNVKPKVSGKQNPAACPTPIPAKPTSVA
ncbi:hypothetical protein GOBAR_AA09965 [Gossypium barbadense]|uniref:Polygalacturonase-like n=1 Tax=Gossypium barbadense TaxID=3634 RepID=A0A2P5Y529_GOSBA|nr:hypothetical protein GOBAR_AA09965 [Gossypium barbadense]